MEQFPRQMVVVLHIQPACLQMPQWQQMCRFLKTQDSSDKSHRKPEFLFKNVRLDSLGSRWRSGWIQISSQCNTIMCVVSNSKCDIYIFHYNCDASHLNDCLEKKKQKKKTK